MFNGCLCMFYLRRLVYLCTNCPALCRSLLAGHAEAAAAGRHPVGPVGKCGARRPVLVPLHPSGLRLARNRAPHRLQDLPVSLRRLRQLHPQPAAGHAVLVSAG